MFAFYGDVDGGEIIDRIFGYGSELNKWRDVAILIGFVILYHALHFVVLWLVNRSYGHSQTEGFVAAAISDDLDQPTPDGQEEESRLEFAATATDRAHQRSNSTASMGSKDSLETFV